MYTISKEFAFSAGHALGGLSEGHPCSRPHGHNYVVRLFLASPTLSRVGFVRDYGDLSEFGGYLNAVLDHRMINDVWPDLNPTAEQIAARLYGWAHARWPEVMACAVSETPKTWALYRPECSPPKRTGGFVSMAADDLDLLHFAGSI